MMVSMELALRWKKGSSLSAPCALDVSQIFFWLGIDSEYEDFLYLIMELECREGLMNLIRFCCLLGPLEKIAV